MKKNVIIFEHNIQKYPPILYVLNFLIARGESIEVFSCCPDECMVQQYKEKGVSFHNIIDNNVKDPQLKKLTNLLNFRKEVLKSLQAEQPEDIRLWLFGESCIWLFYKLVYRFKSILYLFEIPSFSVKFKYKLLSWGINYAEVLKQGHKVVCCEYNRAHVTKAYFGLFSDPIVIPNKPYIVHTDHFIENKSTIDLSAVLDKKIILYQGIFNYPERKMESFCEAINFLPNDFVICLMGEENFYKSELKARYESERVIFLPYQKAPSHLEITKSAYIGYLSYSPESGNIKNVLNTLYCAPNKIFEYSKFGIPMISNDVPALSYLFDKFNSGRVFDNDSQSIAAQIIEIDERYDSYSKGSSALYSSVNLDDSYLQLLS